MKITTLESRSRQTIRGSRRCEHCGAVTQLDILLTATARREAVLFVARAGRLARQEAQEEMEDLIALRAVIVEKFPIRCISCGAYSSNVLADMAESFASYASARWVVIAILTIILLLFSFMGYDSIDRDHRTIGAAVAGSIMALTWYILLPPRRRRFEQAVAAANDEHRRSLWLAKMRSSLAEMDLRERTWVRGREDIESLRAICFLGIVRHLEPPNALALHKFAKVIDAKLLP